MCGIYGIVNLKSDDFISSDVLQGMSRLLRHRGPDDTGIFIDKNVGLGNNRLSIIDIEGGYQPIFNETRSLCTVYNGEIYNYKSLREELRKQGHVFATNTDSEIVVHAYEEWGYECVKKFRGMFAFALWDSVNQKLFMARDRMGIKPFYYIKTDQYFAFASEAKAFKALNNHGFAFQLNEIAADLFLKYSRVPDNEICMFAGIKKLLPGYTLVLQNNELSFSKFWSLEVSKDASNLSHQAAVELVDEKLRDSVESELVSDVSVGVLLSGGVDSSSVAALYQSVSTERIPTFTIGFNHKLDERMYAKLVSQHLNTEHHEFEVDSKEVLSRFDEMVWYLDDLTSGDPGFFSTYLLSERVKDVGVKVVLVGEGSDEIFGGYPRFSLASFPFNILPFYASTLAYNTLLNSHLFPRLSDYKEIQSLYKILKPVYSKHKDIFRCITNYEINYKLPNHFLRKVDLATMAHSVEARVPFLDYKLVEFVYSLPMQYKSSSRFFSLRNTDTKHLLRQTMSKYLPAVIVDRNKMGFLLNIPDVLKKGDKMVKEYILDERSSARIFYPRSDLERLFTAGSNRFVDAERSFMLWKLFLLSAWYRVYMC